MSTQFAVARIRAEMLAGTNQAERGRKLLMAAGLGHRAAGLIVLNARTETRRKTK